MGIKHTIEDRIERIGSKYEMAWRRYDRRHPRPNAIDYTATGVLGSVGLASEVAAIKLATKPASVPKVVAQVGLHGLAVGTTYIAGMMHQNAINEGAKK